MAEEKIARIAREIYENVGGTQNVKKLIHCMTRVRMTIIDDSKVNLAGLKAIDGVMGVVEDETLQVVIGPGTVNKVAQAMVETVGVRLGETFPSAEGQSIDDLMAKTKSEAKEKYNKPSKFKAVLNTISKIFVPLIPAFVLCRFDWWPGLCFRKLSHCWYLRCRNMDPVYYRLKNYSIWNIFLLSHLCRN